MSEQEVVPLHDTNTKSVVVLKPDTFHTFKYLVGNNKYSHTGAVSEVAMEVSEEPAVSVVAMEVEVPAESRVPAVKPDRTRKVGKSKSHLFNLRVEAHTR